MRTSFCVGGRYDTQRTLVIRIPAITLAIDSAITIAGDCAITIARLHPSREHPQKKIGFLKLNGKNQKKKEKGNKTEKSRRKLKKGRIWDRKEQTEVTTFQQPPFVRSRTYHSHRGSRAHAQSCTQPKLKDAHLHRISPRRSAQLDAAKPHRFIFDLVAQPRY